MPSVAAVLSDDTHNIVDAALARVREDARLDADPVLPPLHVLRPLSPRWRGPESTILVPTPVPLPSAEAIVARHVLDATKKNAPTVGLKPKAAVRKARWPVILCGFVAGVFAGAAFMQSPVGHRPAVQHAVKVAKSHAAGLYAATKHTIASHT